MIKLSQSLTDEKEIAATTAVVARGFFGMGSEVAQFEKELEAYFGRPVACVVNGTAALHLALDALDLDPADEVLVPALTYVASFQAISATGAKPIACDINPSDLNIDLDDAKAKLTSKTKVIMPVHFGGDATGFDQVISFAKQHGLRIVEDAAHAFGSSYNGRKVGSYGDIACFSFDGIKNITSGEGGCIVTTDLKVLERVRDCRLLGVINDTEKRYNGERSWDFDVCRQGWRYHMSDLMAAIGRVQLAKIERFAEKRRDIAKTYDNLLKNTSVSIFQRNYNEVVPHLYSILLPEGRNNIEVKNYMQKREIEVGLQYKPNNYLTKFSSQHPKNIKQLYSRLVNLPIHCSLSSNDLNKITNTLLGALL